VLACCLAIERDRHKTAEQERDDAIVARQESEERLRDVLVTQDALTASQAARSSHDPSDQDTDTEASGIRKACETVAETTRKMRKTIPATEPSSGGDKVKPTRRHGRRRPAPPDQSEAEIEEWWTPGWRDRLPVRGAQEQEPRRLILLSRNLLRSAPCCM
jgi:hypothetical protein